jgi:hypothetical protein
MTGEVLRNWKIGIGIGDCGKRLPIEDSVVACGYAGTSFGFLIGRECYLSRFALLALRSVRIWVMAMPLSMARRSGCGNPCRTRTELRLSRLVRRGSAQ